MADDTIEPSIMGGWRCTKCGRLFETADEAALCDCDEPALDEPPADPSSDPVV